MPITQYCWRCKMEVPMLSEAEWEVIVPLLRESIKDVKRYREAHEVTIAEAKDNVRGDPALAKYKELTGFAETNVNAIWHHRASIYGPLCGYCGKPLRTPQANLCAECGRKIAA